MVGVVGRNIAQESSLGFTREMGERLIKLGSLGDRNSPIDSLQEMPDGIPKGCFIRRSALIRPAFLNASGPLRVASLQVGQHEILPVIHMLHQLIDGIGQDVYLLTS